METQVPEVFNLATFLLDRHLSEGRGNKVALYFRDRSYTYSELADQANRLGNALARLGVEAENRVVLCLPDSPAFYVGYFAAMKIGAVPVPVSTAAVPQDYVYFLNDSRAKALIIDETLAPVIRGVRDQLRFLKHFIVVGEPEAGELSFEDLLQRGEPTLEAYPTSKDDMAFWLYSSGTTGRPKGVVHLHHDLLHFMPPHCREVVRLEPGDRVFSVSKLYFSYGRNNSLDSVFLTGASVVLYPGKPDPDKVLDVLEGYRPTVFYSVPTSYAGILRYLQQSGRRCDLSFLRCCVSAGEALPRTVFEQWRERFGLSILDGIGSSDVGAIFLSNRPDCLRPGATGKLLPGFEARLVDPEGREVGTGEIGTLWVRNDGITAGYWNKHELTKKSLVGDWFITGDQFYRDSDGFFWYAGRADDMIKAGGIWVSPLEVEGVLREHPAVADCAVIGAPDLDGLEKPLAFVITNDGYAASSALEQELQQYVRSRLAHYKYPRWVRFVEDLPRTASGKVQRYKLRAQIQEELRG
ncbi:MAG: benzoate-CoA ligase family protein [Moorellales bacterium]